MSVAASPAPPSAASTGAPDALRPTSLYVETSHALPLVTLAVAVRVGASSDPVGKEGLTRVVARMLRRGCRGLLSHEIEERIDSLGAELSADIASSVLTFHADVITRSVDEFVDLLARVLAEPTFDTEELGRLLRETEGELIDARDNDRALVTRAFRRELFEGHAYGRPVGGTLKTIRGLTHADVVEQYRRIFVRENVSIAVAGDVTSEHAERLAARLLSGLPSRPFTRDEVPPPEPRPGRRLVFVDKPERTQTQILIGCVGSHPRDTDHDALHVATTVFGGTFTSRMMRAIRSERGWSYGAYARLGFDRQRDSFTMWAFPAAKDAADCIRLELDLLTAWRKSGITASELAFAKRYLVRSHAFEIDTAPKRVHQALEVELFDLPKTYHADYIKHVQAVSRAAANQAIAERISDTSLVVAVVGTHREIGDVVAKAIPDLAHEEVVAYDSDT